MESHKHLSFNEIQSTDNISIVNFHKLKKARFFKIPSQLRVSQTSLKNK